MILIIVYTAGRFGPEKIHGYAVVEDAESLHETTHLTYDIVSRIDSLNNLRQQIAEYKTTSRVVHVTNPKGISNLQEYRKWQRHGASALVTSAQVDCSPASYRNSSVRCGEAANGRRL